MATTYEVHALYNDGSTIRNTDIKSAAYADSIYRDYLPMRGLHRLELLKRNGAESETLSTWAAPAKTVCPDCLNTGWICTSCGDVLADCQCEAGESDPCECTRCE